MLLETLALIFFMQGSLVLSATNALFAEAWALHEGLVVAANSGFTCQIVECDSIALVHILQPGKSISRCMLRCYNPVNHSLSIGKRI